MEKLDEEQLRSEDCPCVARTTLLLRKLNEIIDWINKQEQLKAIDDVVK